MRAEQYIEPKEIALFRFFELINGVYHVYIVFKSGRDLTLELSQESYIFLTSALSKKLIFIKEI